MEDTRTFKCGKYTLVFHSDRGTFDITKENSRTRIINASIRAVIIVEDNEEVISTVGSPVRLTEYEYAGNIGRGIRIRADYGVIGRDGVKISADFTLYENTDFITLETTLTNAIGKDIKISELSVFYCSASENGGILIEDSPENCIIFENGLGATFEFFVHARNGDEESDSSMMQYIYSKRKASENLLVGMLEMHGFLGDIITNDEEDEGKCFGNRKTIAEYKPRIYFPVPRLLRNGDTLSSGVWIIRIDAPDGFTALEEYADTVALFNGIRIWKGPIPHGWNSWGNPVKGYEEYSYSTDIDEHRFLENLELAVKYFGAFGLEYWQIDSGYTPHSVMNVFEIDKERFPNGMKFIADKIHEKGLKAGIWINPFNVGINSKIYAENKDMFPDPDPGFIIKDKAWRPLDISHPEGEAYLRRCIRKAVHEWGFDLLKVDFAYMNMGPREFYMKDYCAQELHRKGWRIIREEAGPDVFIFGIGGPLSLHIGSVDGERITLDNLPQWSVMDEKLFDIPQTEGSVIFNIRNFTRRYFLHNRVWINHLDCIALARPSMQKNEKICLVSIVGLLGGIWKIADKLGDLGPWEIDTYRKILPVYGRSARPLDLFEMLIPEIYLLELTEDRKILGIFNWGVNRNLIDGSLKEGYAAYKPGDYIKTDGGKRYHLFEFWSETYTGLCGNGEEIKIKLKPRSCAVYSVVTDRGLPVFLSANRHIIQYGIGVKETKYDKNMLITEVDLPVVEDFEFKLFYFIPNGFGVGEIRIDYPPKITVGYKKNTTEVNGGTLLTVIPYTEDIKEGRYGRTIPITVNITWEKNSNT